MYLDAGGVQRHSLDLDANHLLALQFLEHLVQYACLGPATHARVDRVPVAESFGQATPLAAMLGYVQHCVDYLQIGEDYIAALPGQAVFDARKLF